MAHPFYNSPGNRNARPTNPQGARFTVAQPTYDFLAHPETPIQDPISRRSVIVGNQPPPTHSTGQAKIDLSNEGIRGELNALKYELSTIKSDRELERVRHEDEVRALRAQVEEKAKLADTIETDKRFLFEKQKSLSEELEKAKEAAETAKHEQDKLIRQLRSQLATAQDLADERGEDLKALERQSKRQQDELEARNKALSNSLTQLQQEYDENMATLQETQSRFSAKELENESLKTEIIRLQAVSGDHESLGVMKRELSQQLAQIKTLEVTNRKLTAEAKTLREIGKNVEVLEEQKTALEGKVKMMDTLRKELSEKELQLSIMKDEKLSWSAFLEDNEGKLGGKGFGSPQEIARALMEERVEKAELMERLGRVEPELAERDEAIERAEKEKEEVKKELEKIVESYKKLHASRARIERNRQIALKEVGLLKEQLKSYSMEESNLMSGNFDNQKTQMISELEDLLETYKKENESLLSDISKHEKLQSSAPSAIPESLKRTHEESTSPSAQDEEKIGQLTRRARHYQEEVTKLKKSEAVARKELKAANSRIAALEQSVLARKRILELKDNPTARHEAVKAEQLRILRAENDGLLQLLERKPRQPGTELVPAASIKAISNDLAELKKQIAEKDKRMARLKQIWTQKSVEWRQAVHSIVGILFDFMPNGRVRVSSGEWWEHANGGGGAGAGGGGGQPGDAEDPGIVFDGEQGTMKISPEGFSRSIAPLVKLWVEERGDIPGLIAALTMGRGREGGADGMEE